MKVLYFGIYDPEYSRNWILLNGLRKNGVNVLELRQKPGRLALLKLFFSYLKFKQDYDVMVVSFPGQETMFLARLLRPFGFIVFDAFTSHYGGYVLDRKKFSKTSFRAKYYRFLDKWSCKLADLVLLDTQTHINFFIKEYNLPRKKFRRIWAGANDEIFKPAVNSVTQNGFKVLFFGTYIPLQGVEYIVKAAKTLEQEKDILFTLIGNGQERKKAEELALSFGLKNLVFKGMMKPENLKDEIEKCNVSLGVFGNSPKTEVVIPNKIFISLAMKKPVITADTEAVRELFGDQDILLVPKADEKEIARAIIKLKNDITLGERIARNGYEKFVKFASHKVLGFDLKNIIYDTRNSLSE